MKAIILAGGYGTRLKDTTIAQPKPMVNVGDKPILWHIINILAVHNIREFIIALGYKGNIIKDYFYKISKSTLDNSINKNTYTVLLNNDLKIHLVDTGLNTMTGGRLKRLNAWVKDDDAFMFTYADGLADIDIRQLLKFHNSHGKLATITAVNPPERFGRINLNGDNVTEFNEKPKIIDSWINGGFFVCEPDVFNYVDEGDKTIFEREPLEKLAKENEINCFKHDGFWKCMDTLADKNKLSEMWKNGEAKWKTW